MIFPGSGHDSLHVVGMPSEPRQAPPERVGSTTGRLDAPSCGERSSASAITSPSQSESFIHDQIYPPSTRNGFRMPTEYQRLEDLSAIRRYVSETLCEKDQLEANYFPLSEQVLVRGGAPCGVYFCLHGPRSLCLTAVWETDSNTILFYGSRGERFRKTQLISPPGSSTRAAASGS